MRPSPTRGPQWSQGVRPGHTTNLADSTAPEVPDDRRGVPIDLHAWRARSALMAFTMLSRVSLPSLGANVFGSRSSKSKTPAVSGTSFFPRISPSSKRQSTWLSTSIPAACTNFLRQGDLPLLSHNGCTHSRNFSLTPGPSKTFPRSLWRHRCRRINMVWTFSTASTALWTG